MWTDNHCKIIRVNRAYLARNNLLKSRCLYQNTKLKVHKTQKTIHTDLRVRSLQNDHRREENVQINPTEECKENVSIRTRRRTQGNNEKGDKGHITRGR